MNSVIKLDPYRLHIFHEGKTRRIFIGELSYHPEKRRYEFIYNKHYTQSKNAIPVGAELSLFKLKHITKNKKLFPSFLDRIPDKHNPAYVDYCKAQGISPTEDNPIILLGSIGRRGPSSFIFEPVYITDFSVDDIIKLRNQLDISQHDLSLAFDISTPTLQRIEAGTSSDPYTLKRIQIMLQFPEVALWQLKQSGSRIHKDALIKLTKYFKGKLNN